MIRFTACAAALLAVCAAARASEPIHSAELDEMIARQARRHGVPEKLVRRIVMRESKYNPRARNHAFWGLMQISYPTARSMGFKGSPRELLDPLVNLTYAVPYLANAFIIAGKQEDAAVRLYASGYYETAKNRNLLTELRTADSTPVAPEDGFLTAAARPVSNLLAAVVTGPAQRPVSELSAAPQSPAIDADKGLQPEVMMVSGKSGTTPPPKWIKDGGVTLIARGEQRVDQVAAARSADDDAGAKHTRHAAAHGKTRKTTEFAALEAPLPGAQAYAPGTATPETGPQAAISQATTAPAPPANAPGAAETTAPDQAALSDETAKTGSKATKTVHAKASARSAKAHSPKAHAVAMAKTEDSAPASAH